MNITKLFQKKRTGRLKLTGEGCWTNTKLITDDGVLIPGVQRIEVDIRVGEATRTVITLLDIDIDLTNLDLSDDRVNEVLKEVYEDEETEDN
jgi:hypothetical protein